MRGISGSEISLFSRKLEMKVIYSTFLLFMLIGYVSITALEYFSIGISYDDIVKHYLGSELEEEMAFPMPFTQMLQHTHFHAFMSGIVLFVMGHLFTCTRQKANRKLFYIYMLFGSSMVNLVSPWLIRYVNPVFAYCKLFSWAFFGFSFVAIILILFYELWFVKK